MPMCPARNFTFFRGKALDDLLNHPSWWTADTAQPFRGRTVQVNTPKAIVASPDINLDILYEEVLVRESPFNCHLRVRTYVWRTRRRRHLNVKTAQVSWKVTNCSCFFSLSFLFLGKWRILLGWGHREASFAGRKHTTFVSQLIVDLDVFLKMIHWDAQQIMQIIWLLVFNLIKRLQFSLTWSLENLRNVISEWTLRKKNLGWL